MDGSRFVLSGSTIVAATAAFLAGRSSVPKQEPAGSTEAAEAWRSKIVSALAPVSDGGHTDTGPGTSTSPDNSTQARDQRNAETAPEYLASFVEHLDELGNSFEPLAAWLDKNPDAAIEWLGQAERGNDALKVLFALWGEHDADAAEAWLTAHHGSHDGK